MSEIENKNEYHTWLMKKCNEWFDELAELLKDKFVVVESNNKAAGSRCLVPKGTENQVSYYGKPYNSFRVAKNWNWRANLNKCTIPNYVQCFTTDMPWPSRRGEDQTKGTQPMLGWAVMYFGVDRQYHVMYGEKFDRESGTWSVVSNDVNAVADMAKRALELTEQPKGMVNDNE